MKIEHMRYVLEVSNWKSINKASSHLYINQQQLSRIIAAVEKELEVEIFNRNTKGIFLTPQGEEVVKKFEQILAIYDSIGIKNANLANAVKGHINVFNEANIWTGYARFYKDFAKTYPNIRCNIYNMATEEILQALVKQDGIGLISRARFEGIEPYPIPQNLDFTIINHHRLTVYGSSDNPYVKKYSSISLATLAELPLINFKPYQDYPSLLEQAFQNFESPNIKYEVSNIHVFRELVAETDCLFVACKKPQYIIDDSIREITLRNEIIVENGLVKRKNASKLYDIFQEYYRNYYKGFYS
ncbi:MAG: LysR family transcriptional regulator [Peptococcaceae bacterium]|nr:LysR family transcriptional regulator [Peptococcaceae bacterium]MBQ3205109.1 LysR family transcriptional regulator [Peptococcaceae bacterium]